MRQWQIDARPSRSAEKRTAPHWQPPVRRSFGIVAARLDVVPVWIVDEGGVVVLAVFGPKARLAVVLAAGLDRGSIEGIDVGALVATESEMDVARRAGRNPQEREVAAHADGHAALHQDLEATRFERGGVARLALHVIGDVEADVIDSCT